ncbi:MAG: hypothetical protein PIK35_12360 [Enterobacter roggenkampii]
MSSNQSFGAPNEASTPARGTENQQLQWVMESLSRLQQSHESMLVKMDARFDTLDSRIEDRHNRLDTKIDSKIDLIEHKITSNHTIVESKITTCELKISKDIADSKIAHAKWIVGIIFGLPAVFWMGYQLVHALLTK